MSLYHISIISSSLSDNSMTRGELGVAGEVIAEVVGVAGGVIAEVVGVVALEVGVVGEGSDVGDVNKAMLCCFLGVLVGVRGELSFLFAMFTGGEVSIDVSPFAQFDTTLFCLASDNLF